MDKLFKFADPKRSNSFLRKYQRLLRRFVVFSMSLIAWHLLAKSAHERTQVFKERMLKGFELWNGVGAKRNKVLNLDLHTVFDECLSGKSVKRFCLTSVASVDWRNGVECIEQHARNFRCKGTILWVYLRLKSCIPHSNR